MKRCGVKKVEEKSENATDNFQYMLFGFEWLETKSSFF